MGRPKSELCLSEAEEAQLSSIARSRSISAALAQRARIVLACASAESNSAVARRFELTNATVGKWRACFVKHRIAGLYDELRPGRPRTIDDERVAGLIRKTLNQKPKDGSTPCRQSLPPLNSPESSHRRIPNMSLPRRSARRKIYIV
jgi:putative transposase